MGLQSELNELTMVSLGGRAAWSWAGLVPNFFFV